MPAQYLPNRVFVVPALAISGSYINVVMRLLVVPDSCKPTAYTTLNTRCDHVHLEVSGECRTVRGRGRQLRIIGRSRLFITRRSLEIQLVRLAGRCQESTLILSVLIHLTP